MVNRPGLYATKRLAHRITKMRTIVMIVIMAMTLTTSTTIIRQIIPIINNIITITVYGVVII
jgi:hypothetical protein